MLTTTATPTATAELSAPAPFVARALRTAFTFVGERLWLDFVNTDRGANAPDAIPDFDALVAWLETSVALGGDRALMMRRRAVQQPSGATAALVDARRVRASLRALAERGGITSQARL